MLPPWGFTIRVAEFTLRFAEFTPRVAEFTLLLVVYFMFITLRLILPQTALFVLLEASNNFIRPLALCFLEMIYFMFLEY